MTTTTELASQAILSPPRHKVLQGQRDYRKWSIEFLTDAQFEGLEAFFTGHERLTPLPQAEEYGLNDAAARDKRTKEDREDPVVEFDYTEIVEEDDPTLKPVQLSEGESIPTPKKKVKKTRKLSKRRSTLTPDELSQYQDRQREKSRKSNRKTLGPDDLASILEETTFEDAPEQATAPKWILSYTERLALYKFNLEQHQKSLAREQKAIAMLARRVSDAIRPLIRGIEDPFHAWIFIKNQYKLSDEREQEIAHDRFEQIHFNNHRNIQDYLNELQGARTYLQEVGDDPTDAAMVSKIIRGLQGAPEYKDFRRHYHQFRNIDPSLQGYANLSSRLLTWESDLKASPEQANASFAGSKGQSRSSETKKPDIRCNECGKKGHYARDCRSRKDKGKSSSSTTVKTTRTVAQSKKPFNSKKVASFASTDVDRVTSALTSKLGHKQVIGTSPLSTPHQIPADSSTSLERKGGDGGSVGVRAFLTCQSRSFDSLCNAVLPSSIKGKGIVPNTWIVDSGANLHLVNNKRWFSTYTELHDSVGTADGKGQLRIEGGGTVSLTLQTKDDPVELILTTVVYAPDLRCNILSTSLLARKGRMKGWWDEEGMVIQDSDGQEVANARLTVEGLYQLNVLGGPEYQQSADGAEKEPMSMPPGVRPPYVMATVDFSDPVWKWHRRMGHLGFENLRRLLKVSDGINLTDKQIKAKLGAVCPICATTRAVVRIPREPATRRFKDTGNLIHLDTWGPYPVIGWDRTKLFLLATDDATRYTWYFRLKSKDEIPQGVRRLLKLAERTHQFKTRRVRFDNELFNNGLITAWLNKHSITIEPTAAYAHNQNGVAERGHRTERDKSSAMLQEASVASRVRTIISERGQELLRNTEISESLWPEAFAHAIWLKNRSPTRALKTKRTPWEMLTGNRPNLANERVWGSRTYVTHPHELRTAAAFTKIGTPRAWIGYFVGCTSESGYKVWDPDQKKVRRTAVANVDDGEGTDDLHADDRVQEPTLNSVDQDEAVERSDSGSQSPSEHSDSEVDLDAVDPQETPTSGEDPTNQIIYNAGGEVDLDSEDSALEDSDSDSLASPSQNQDEDTLFVDQQRSTSTSPSPQGQTSPQLNDASDQQVQDDIDDVTGNLFDGINDVEQAAGEGQLQRLLHEEGLDSDFEPEAFMAGQKRSAESPDDSAPKRAKPNSRTVLTPIIPKEGVTGLKPKPDRCRRCFVKRIKCGPERPCKNCTDLGPQYQCVPQDSMSEALIPEANKALTDIKGVNKDDKCHHCRVHSFKCNGETPCNTCTRYDVNCRPYEVMRKTPGQPEEDKCHACVTQKRRCSKKGPYSREDPCDFCKKKGLRCVNYGELTKARKGVPKEEKCTRCLKRQTACNGQQPCDKCLKSNNPTEHCLRQGQQKQELPPKCSKCRTNGGACDRKHPCSQCVKNGKNCIYHLSDDKKHYIMTSPDSPILPTGEECCAYCAELESAGMEFTSDRQFPCNMCIERRARRDNYNTCKRDYAPGVIEVHKIIANEEEARQRGFAWYESHHKKQKRDNKIDDTQDRLVTNLTNHSLSRNGLTEPVSSLSQPFQGGNNGECCYTCQAAWDKFPRIPTNQRAICSLCTTDLALDPEPHNRRQALARPDADHWKDAMDEEYQSLLDNETWKAVRRPTHQKTLTGRWVLKRKLGPDGSVARYKARFVVRGFEQVHGIDFDETFASVVKPPSYKLFFALASKLGWHCHQMDVKTAFLYGEVDEDIYIEPPDGYPEARGRVLKLKKSLYGLKQAPRQWYSKLRQFLESKGWKASKYDSSVFMNREGLYMTVYVDDINIFGGNLQDIERTKEVLKERFKMSDLGPCAYYLGMHVETAEDGSKQLHQSAFVQQLLNRFKLNDLRPVSTPMDVSRKLESNKDSTASVDFLRLYQSMVGSLNYLMTVARPDIAHAVGVVSRYSANPNQRHMDAVRRVYAYLKKYPDIGPIYSATSSQSLCELVGFVDSDWAGCHDTRRSTTGWVFTLGGCVIAWASRRQKSVALSTCEAEYIAAAEAAKEAIWLLSLLKELNVPGIPQDAIKLHIDNNAAMKLTKNPEFHARTKHIELRHHFLREQVLEGNIEMIRVDTKDNLADIFTKALPRATHERMMILSNLVRPEDNRLALSGGEEQ